MNESAVNLLLSHREYIDTLAWLLAVAILVGGVLDRKGKDLLQWVVSVFFFAVFNALGSYAVMRDTSPQVATPLLYFTILNAMTYFTGLVLGWALASLSKRWYFYRKINNTGRSKHDR